MDSKRAGTIAIASFILLCLIWGLLSIMPDVISKENSSNAISTSEANVPAVIVYHKSKDSMHTYTGSIDLPTPCHLLESTTTVDYSEPAHISVALSIQQPTGACAQVVTQQKFSTTITSDAIPSITVSIDGTEARPVVLEEK